MIILSEIQLNEKKIPKDFNIIYLNNNIKMYSGNKDVIVIVGSRALSRKVNNLKFDNLKLFQLTSAGFDNVPLQSFKNKGVIVCNAGDVYSIPIAEAVIYSMLLMCKKYWKNPNFHFLRPMRHYKYISELNKKKVLILGAGNIGTSIAKMLKGFQMEVFGYDPYCAEKEDFLKIIRNRNELTELLASIDFLVSTLPENEETIGFLDSNLLSLLKKEAIIINVGRKSTINNNDLYNCLRYKKINGAVLDMFEKIPNPFTNKFRRLKNVIVLPGVAAISKECKNRLKDLVTFNIIAVYKDKPLSNVVNKI